MNRSTKQKIANLAATIPASIEEYNVPDIMTGSMLLEKGIKEIDGKEVMLTDRYPVHITLTRQINHFARLEKEYKRSGPEHFYKNYMTWLAIHQNKMAEKYPDLYKSTVGMKIKKFFGIKELL